MENYILNKEVELEQLEPGVSRKVLSHDENIMVVEVHFEQDAVGAVHSHVHEQIAYVVSGKFEFTTNGTKQIVETGDSIYFESNIPHGVVCLEAGTLLDTFTPRREDFLK